MLLGVAVLAGALSARAAEPSIAQTIVADAHVMGYVRGLLGLGTRLSGTPGYQRAVEWAVDEFRAEHLDRVSVEPFTIHDGWVRESARAVISSPEQKTLTVASLGWTPSTDGAIDADVVALSESTAPHLTADAARVAGRIVLVRDAGWSAAAMARRREFDRALARAGARAVLSEDADQDGRLAARDRTAGAAVGALPAAQIARDDAEWLRRMIDRGPVRMTLELRNRVTPGPVTVNSVVAEIRGGERRDEVVMVGAHLDAWDFATAAQDNATGVAMVLEAARVLGAQPRPPRRSIRFVLWGGEEQGQLGSNAYVAAHQAELDRLVAYLNTDAGSGRLIGWTTPGRRDVADAGRRWLVPRLAEVTPLAFDIGTRYAFQSDGAAFIRSGIPTFDLNADDSAYEEIHHKVTDTVERIDEHNLVVAAAVVAESAWAIADAPSRVAPRGRGVK